MRRGWWTLSICTLTGISFVAAVAEEGRSPGAAAPAPRGSSLFPESAPAAPAGPPVRYSRTATAPPATTPEVKNFYNELFEEADREAARRVAEIEAAAAANRPAPATPAAAPTAATNAAAAGMAPRDNRYRELLQASEPAAAAPAPKPGITFTDSAAPAKPAPATQNPFAAPAPAAARTNPAAARPAPARPAAPSGIVPASATTEDPAAGVIHAEYNPIPGESSRRVEQIKATGAPVPTIRQTLPARTPAAAPPLSAASPSRPSVAAVASQAGPQAPSVTLEWVAQGECNVGQECKVALVVKNTGRCDVQDVTVDASFPPTVRLTAAKPAPAESTGRLVWSLGNLATGQETTIEVSLIPSKRGELAANANVRFSGTAMTLLAVEEPLLKIALKGPSEVMVGDPASQLVTVSNPGSGTAMDVVLDALVPAGLEHAGGKRLSMNIGSLGPGESRAVRLALAAVGGGEQTLMVEARSARANLVQASQAKINVIAPSLELKASGPGLRYLNRNATYVITVANNSTAATNNVRVVEQIPAGFELIKASHGGQTDATRKNLNWFVGRLEAGQSVDLTMELAAREMGTHVHQIRAVADNGVQASTSTETKVDGSASIVMEVADLDDPVEVGAETAYEIRIRNEGTKGASNVAVSCELPAGVTLINCVGPTKHAYDKGLLVFGATSELAPNQTLTYRVHVRGAEAGNLRFRAQLTSDSMQKPLVIEESTKFYAD